MVRVGSHGRAVHFAARPFADPCAVFPGARARAAVEDGVMRFGYKPGHHHGSIRWLPLRRPCFSTLSLPDLTP
jgi:hypothetical protein